MAELTPLWPSLKPATGKTHDCERTNPRLSPLLTDLYQLTMACALVHSGRQDVEAVFEVFFRKCPFGGEFCIFCGIDDVIELVESFRFTPADVAAAKAAMPAAPEAFFRWLETVDTTRVRIDALPPGSLCFPRVPVARISGPLGVCQLLETAILNLTNFASLVSTNAARFRRAAGRSARLLEFGLRRAQGPDGALSASKYCFAGGFDATSNVLASATFGIPASGTMAHAFVQSFPGEDASGSPTTPGGGPPRHPAALAARMIGDVDILAKARELRRTLPVVGKRFALGAAGAAALTTVGDSELAAFVAYACTFPDGFVALVDTYDTLRSGVPNFAAVAAVMELHTPHRAVGMRLDSGDLAYLSRESRKYFVAADAALGTHLAGLRIVASNDIDEHVLLSLQDQSHAIDVFGIGTHIVTCKAQPALGMVYKLCSMDGAPCVKLSQEPAKSTIPGDKSVWRLIGPDFSPVVDILGRAGVPPPMPGARTLCHHPADLTKRAYVVPRVVCPLLGPVWVGARAPLTAADVAEEAARAAIVAGGAATVLARVGGELPAERRELVEAMVAAVTSGAAAAPTFTEPSASREGNLRAAFPPLAAVREFVKAQLGLLREDHARLLNPTPYKVSLTPELHTFMSEVFLAAIPIPEII